MELKRELFWYVVFGVLTTVVNILAYLLFARIFNVNYIYSNIIAWFLSVLFAYITNRIWVFESKSSNIIKEASYFFAGRIFSGVLDTGLMYLHWFIEFWRWIFKNHHSGNSCDSKLCFKQICSFQMSVGGKWCWIQY